jgi:hypothetical protein
MAYLKVLSRHLSGESDENHIKSLVGEYLVAWLRFNLCTQVYSIIPTPTYSVLPTLRLTSDCVLPQQ